MTEFSTGNGTGGVYNYCRSCQAAYARERKRLAKEGRKRCWLCDQIRSVEEFDTPGLVRTRYCRDCQARRIGAVSLRRQFGLTLEEYDQLLESQDGRCYICQRRPRAGKRLAVDHCHTTGLIRGLLCPESQSCNHLLGLLREDVGWLQRAAAYLTRPPAVAVLGERYAPDSVGAAGLLDAPRRRRLEPYRGVKEPVQEPAENPSSHFDGGGPKNAR